MDDYMKPWEKVEMDKKRNHLFKGVLLYFLVPTEL